MDISEYIAFDPDKDNEKAYDEEVMPIVMELLAMCSTHNVPVLIACQFSERGIGTNAHLPVGSSETLVKALKLIYPPAIGTVVPSASA